MPVIYNDCKIIPAPLVNISEEMISAPDGRKVGTTYTITINGTLVSDMGSPQDGTLSGSNWGGPYGLFWTGSNYPANELITVGSKLSSIERKQQALRALFAIDGQWLQFQSPNGDAPLKCQPRLKTIQFPDGIWVNTCNYTIVLECDLLYLNGTPVSNTQTHSELISSVNESWQIQEGDVHKTYTVSHTVGAVGKITYDSLGNTSGYPWENAKQFVYSKLGLGYSGTGNFSTIPVSSLFIASALSLGSVNFNTLSPFNFSRNENIDQVGGSYSLTENWLFCITSGTDVYTISINNIPDESYTTISTSIKGKIVGYNTNLFDYDAKIRSAQWMWSQTRSGLYSRVLNYINNTGISLNYDPTVANIDIDPINGTIDYNYNFDNKYRPQSGVLETFVITKKISPEDYKISYTVNGNIKGRKLDSDTNPNDAFNRAKSYWSTLDPEPVLYNRIISSSFFPEASGLGLSQYPISKNVDLNQGDGVVGYSYEYNNRVNDNNYYNDLIQEDYRVSSNFNREDGKTIYSINGTIIGLNIDGLTRDQRFQNALNYWQNIARPNLYSRIFLYYSGANIPNSNPVSQEVEQAKNGATINYNFSYNNRPSPFLPGVMYESFSVSEQNAAQTVQVIARIPILGRALGPIIQDINTTVEKVRSVNVDVIVGPTGSSNILSSFALKPNYDAYIYQLAPEGGRIQEDNSTWDWINGHLQRNVSWIYE